VDHPAGKEDMRMWHRTVGYLVTLVLSILVLALAATARPVGKVHRIGRLTASHPPAGADPFLEALRQGLRELGYVEGQNLALEVRWGERNPERFPTLMNELVRLPVEVIVAGGNVAVQAAQQATRTLPIVMSCASDPVGRGFVASLAHPGGNITGLSCLNEELIEKRLQLFKEAVPQLSRLAVLSNSAVHARQVQELTAAGQALGLQVHPQQVRSAPELENAFAAMSREGADGLMVPADATLLDGLRGRIAELAAKSRLPAMYVWRMYVEAGGLMSYGLNLPDMHRRTASYVDRLLKGAKPGDLPVEQPTKFELVINLKAAQALGLTMPPSILFQADEVIR
jgi:putative tryptophan/tyrosine transport system substrate-binding protein